MTTVADLLRARADDDHAALLFEGASYSWRELVAEADVRAAWARTVRAPGPTHIGVLLENLPEFVFWIAGAALDGATVVGINPTRRGDELAADIRHTDCRVLVTDRERSLLLDGLDVGVESDRVLLVDDPAYHDVLGDARPATDPAHADERSTLLLLFTSGSTGAPKAVVCSQGRLAAIAATSSRLFGITADDVLYQAMPLFHGNAIMANLLPALAQGATVALRRRFSASGFLPDARAFGATYFNYVGRALAYILATPPTPHDRDNALRLGFGTEASARDIERFTARFGCEIVENYGSSEGVVTILRAPDTPDAALGRPPDTPAMDVVVVDPDTARECPRAHFDEHGTIVNAGDAIGEIVNRAGAGAFEGYYRNDEAVRDRTRNGWYWTGDLGYRDEQGWFYFAGRSSDWLRVDSENFAAAPVERILARLPDVVLAAVYPVPDVRTGDQVMAALELAEGAFEPDAFAAFLDEQRDLGTKWAPRFVRLVPAMPVTANNKVAKQGLRRERWETTDPVYWRPRPGEPYRLMTDDDLVGLRHAFEAEGRAQLLAL